MLYCLKKHAHFHLRWLIRGALSAYSLSSGWQWSLSKLIAHLLLCVIPITHFLARLPALHTAAYYRSNLFQRASHWIISWGLVLLLSLSLVRRKSPLVRIRQGSPTLPRPDLIFPWSYSCFSHSWSRHRYLFSSIFSSMSFDNKNSQFVDSRAGCVEILVMFMYPFLLYLVVWVYV
jgi:hypothetical protein